jgi:hypothetical protein
VDEGDHGTGGLVHDLLDQLERVLGALAETDEGDVRALARRHCSDVLDLDLAGDHLMPESGDDRRDERQAIRAFVRDQHAQMLGLTMTHSALTSKSNSHGRDQIRRADALGATVLGWSRPTLTPGGQSLPASTLGRRGA